MKPRELLKAQRIVRDMSQKDLAQASGIAAESICKIERGQLPCGWNRAQRLAKALGIRPEQIVSRIDD